MEKKWFIQVKGNQEGPFTLRELKRDPRLSPDTLVKREDWDQWKRAGKVPELQGLFDDDSPRPLRPGLVPTEQMPPDDVVLLLDDTPPNPLMWLYIVLIILIYVLFRLYID